MVYKNFRFIYLLRFRSYLAGNLLAYQEITDISLPLFLPVIYIIIFKPVTIIFKSVSCVHEYNTRFSVNQTFFTLKARTNYGIFNIRSQGTKIWNSIAESTKSLPLSKFKKKNKEKMIGNWKLI